MKLWWKLSEPRFHVQQNLAIHKINVEPITFIQMEVIFLQPDNVYHYITYHIYLIPVNFQSSNQLLLNEI